MYFLLSGRQSLRGAADELELGEAEGQEFESVVKAVAVADGGAHAHGRLVAGKRELEGDGVAYGELTGENGAQAAFPEMAAAAAEGFLTVEFAGDGHPDVELVAVEAAVTSPIRRFRRAVGRRGLAPFHRPAKYEKNE